uniref:Leucine-rich repeat-containing N-terminal plant-type domain-containing protein n=1 Tax=Fagus sylvatica TaxID=28930 RepID=A0A2N9G5V4_FAGSY
MHSSSCGGRPARLADRNEEQPHIQQYFVHKTGALGMKVIDCCSWEGVTCSDVGRVVGVNLDSESISGGLHNSSSLFRLPVSPKPEFGLQRLRLSQIPTELGKLTNLSYLNLSKVGSFGPFGSEGPIPIEISRLTRLVTLDLSTYSYYSLPDLATLVQNLSELEELYLDGGSLPEFNPNGSFRTGASQYKFFWVLPILLLNRNNLIGKISDTFPAYCPLVALNLNGNLLEGVVPKSLSNCTSLEVLDIGNNRIQDAFPCYLKNISTLRILILRSNKFYGSVGCGRQNVTWPMLQIVDLASNNFSDRIPPSLGKLSQLESLDLSSNKLTGKIPMQLADGLIFLSVLNLSYNQLVGQIPFIKQFATFSEASYEGNKGLYGCPLKKECTSTKPSCTFWGENIVESEQIGMGYKGTNGSYEEEYSSE